MPQVFRAGDAHGHHSEDQTGCCKLQEGAIVTLVGARVFHWSTTRALQVYAKLVVEQALLQTTLRTFLVTQCLSDWES